MESEDRPRILIIDGDDLRIRHLQEALAGAGMETIVACGDQQGLERFFADQPDLVVLDRALPVLDAWEVCCQLRQASNVPIVVLGAHESQPDLLHAFQVGADDYMARPVSTLVLIARIEALLRRTPRQALRPSHMIVQVGSLRLDMLRREAWSEGMRLRLSRAKFDLLALLVYNAGHVVSHREIITRLWGDARRSKMASVAAYIRDLRWCIEEDPRRPRHIVTVHGLGYRFVPPASYQHADPPATASGGEEPDGP